VPTAFELAAGVERVPHDTKQRYTSEGEVVDFTPDIQPNYDFFTDGPGYDALD
jgi:hypothetical protein